MPHPPQLLVVMPFYNEQASAEKVIGEWLSELGRTAPDFTLLAIDDGSGDQTPEILKRIAERSGFRMEWISRKNRGHGQTCVQGYRIALERNIPFVFQIDSDGQSDPKYFLQFWNARNDHDVIYGKRERQDGNLRIFASLILRWSLRVFAGVDCVDANVPYRLMRTDACAEAIRAVPEGISLANIALAVMLKRDPSIRHGHLVIGFPPRHGGEPSVPFSKFAVKALELFRQLKLLER